MPATFVIPTRSRPDDLAHTLASLGLFDGPGEVVIIDNASPTPVSVPNRLANGWPVHLIRCERNIGAAARNLGAQAARMPWVFMLDDDSAPIDQGWSGVLDDAPDDVAAIGAEILLPSGRHEAGGLPEVIVGCGALVRTQAFIEAGGYDEAFGFYGEETDLCARLIASGTRVRHDPRLRVLHRRTEVGRDVSTIVERLSCNEPLTIHRYAPRDVLGAELRSAIERRRRVAEREGVLDAFERGVARFRARSAGEQRQPLSRAQWDRLTGLAFARARARQLGDVASEVAMPPGPPGKNTEHIEASLAEAGRLARDGSAGDAVVVGTLAPGLALDAAADLAATEARPVHAFSPLARPATAIDRRGFRAAG